MPDRGAKEIKETGNEGIRPVNFQNTLIYISKDSSSIKEKQEMKEFDQQTI